MSDDGKLESLNEFGERINIIPAEVRGRFRKNRDRLQYFLIIFFLILPWTKINGQQTVLLDVINRKFHLFGLTLHSHDTPLIFFLTFGAALTLAFITSVWGRIWCGWACPQTVFIDGIFRKIETMVEGNYLQRRALQTAPLSFSIVIKKLTKWFLFIFAASNIAHSFAAYFIGAQTLFKMSMSPPAENWGYFLFITSLTGTILFNFAWFREQFCTIMCPYGRIQSVLLDSDSLVVMYDQKRGEPRKGTNSPTDKKGDCVSCGRCVHVCPTGIDIRNGLQMECIACTACIDACDEIMEKIKKPTGLIRYDTLSGHQISLKKQRSIVYIVLILLCFGGLVYNVSKRQTTDWTLLRGGKETPYQIIKEDNNQEMIINHFRIHIQNQGDSEAQYMIQLPESLESMNRGRIILVAPQNPLTLAGGESYTWHFFIKFDPSIITNTGQFKSLILIKDLSGKSTFVDNKEIILLGPK